MHQLFSPLRSNCFLQRVFALLVAVCLLAAGAAPAAGMNPGERPYCAQQEFEACTAHDERSADKSAHHQLDKAPGEIDVPVMRSFRRWLPASALVEIDPGSTGWFGCTAHDPPKTIRFCTLLI